MLVSRELETSTAIIHRMQLKTETRKPTPGAAVHCALWG